MLFLKMNCLSVIILISILLFSVTLSTSAKEMQIKTKPRNSCLFGSRDSIERKAVLTLYPTNFAATTLKAGYEFRISNNKGIKILGAFGSTNSGSAIYALNKFTEFSLEAQLRFYVLKRNPALNGLYMAPFVGYKHMNYSGDSSYHNVYGAFLYPAYLLENQNVSDFSVGYIIGYQWVFNSTFVIDAYIGGCNNFISGNNGGGLIGSSIFAYRNGIDFHSGIGIGIAF